MSSSSVNDLRSVLSDAGSVVENGESLLAPVRRFAFWVAIALPFLYLPLLAIGLDDGTVATAFLTLLACNAVALFVGHSHLSD